MTTPAVDPAWSAARNGLPGDSAAVSQAAQLAAFLATHAITPVYPGNRTWTIASTSGTTGTEFFWVTPSDIWLPAYDADQPVIMPAGVTAIGRIEVAAQAFGTGTALQVTLYPDNGSGDPLVASPIASTIVPSSHVTALSAAGGLASAGPLATSRSSTSLPGPGSTVAWTQPAVSLNGAGDYACPVTSGNWTLFLGGYDATASAATAVAAAVQYLGAGAVSGAVPVPSLPQAAWYLCAAATPDTVIAAGGTNGSGHFTSVWTASWAPSSGTLGSWSAQQALPQAVVNGAMASWNDYVYVAGGSTDGTNGNATAGVWQAAISNGQVTAWTAGPPLPQATIKPFLAVVGDWLIAAGGVSTSGTVLASTWYAAISASGVPGPWTAGPPLPLPVYAFSPNWNLVVTDSAVVLVSGITTGGAASTCTQVLAVSPDGPGPEWQLLDYTLSAGSGTQYQAAAYPSGSPGQWEAFGFGDTSYTSAVLNPVPLISVPLPATGLTPGDTYHLVFRQLGGDALNNYLLLGELAAATPPAPWLYSARGSGGPWTSHANRALMVNVYDQAPSVLPLHLQEDSGARLTSLLWSGAGSQLLGVLESTGFPSGSPESALAPVTQVAYNAYGQPSALVQLA